MLRRSCGTFHDAQPADVAARDEDPARGRDLVAQQELQERRLPRARGADEEDELALGDLQGELTEGDDVAFVRLGDVFETNHVRRIIRGAKRVAAGSRPSGSPGSRPSGTVPD